MRKEKARLSNKKTHAKTSEWDSDMLLPGEGYDINDDGGYGPEEKAPYADVKDPDIMDEDEIEYVDNEDELYERLNK